MSNLLGQCFKCLVSLIIYKIIALNLMQYQIQSISSVPKSFLGKLNIAIITIDVSLQV